MECKKCLIDIVAQPHVFCNGPCSRVFHISCVNLKEELLYPITFLRNFVWLCEECLAEFNKWKDSPRHLDAPSDEVEPKSVDNDIAELKLKVDTIITTLSLFTPPFVPSAPTDSSAVPRHSTPVSSFHLTNGTKTYCDSSYAADVSVRGCEPMHDEQNFSLLLSNIDGSVSEEAVQRMVFRCLGASTNAECKSVKKLVPRGVDCSTLDYVSFKVVLAEKWRSIAMNPSTWPTDITFREFVRLKRTWKPDV